MGRVADQVMKRAKEIDRLQEEHAKVLADCIKGLDEAIQNLVEARNAILTEAYEKVEKIRKKAEELEGGEDSGKAGV